MMTLYLCIVAISAITAVTADTEHLVKREDTCPLAYRYYEPKHTQCYTDVGVPVKLSAEEKMAAVDEHNKCRANVSPRASDMLKLVWDDNLASTATKWAAQCAVKHDVVRLEPSLSGVWVGQNLAAGNMNLVQAIRYWATEIVNFRYGSRPTGVVGHYTQIVNAKTARVGCGVAMCPRSVYKKFQICNYAVGQYTQALKTPFKSGPKGCEECPNKCVKMGNSSGGLCDCGGKICLNGGSLKLATCTCICRRLWKGSQCQTPYTARSLLTEMGYEKTSAATTETQQPPQLTLSIDPVVNSSEEN